MPMSKRHKAVLVIGATLFLFLSIGYAVFYHYYSMMNYEEPEEEISISFAEDETGENLPEGNIGDQNYLDGEIRDNLSSVELLQSKDVTNILLIGTDSRGKDRGRSDAMILLSVNSRKKTLTLTSFLRDIYVRIPGAGNNRLNSAYAYGGASLLIKTLRENFGIVVDRYARVDFFSFIDIIDALGGVSLNVTGDEIGQINNNLKEINKIKGLPVNTHILKTSQAGTIRLNGSQTLAYARIRKIGTDVARAERQRKILTALIKEFKGAGIKELNALLTKVLPLVSTDLKQSDLLRIISMSGSFRNYSVNSQSVPAKGTYSFVTINKMSVISIDFDENIKMLKDTVYG